MIQILKVVSPVAGMMLLGAILRRTGVFSRRTVEELKILVTKIILPVAIFHALATASYGTDTAVLILIMLVMLCVSFGAGYLLRPAMPGEFRKYVPFMVSVYEGGMMAYPLFANLCGVQNLSQIALLDIAGLLFGFSVYMGLLTQTETSDRVDVKKLATDALKNPAFIAAVAGIAAGLSGIVNCLLKTDLGSVYTNLKDMITAPLSAMILLIVGYDLSPDIKLLKPCLRVIAMRAALQAVMIVGVLTAVHRFVGVNPVLDTAVIVYMSAPATFSMQTFLQKEEGRIFVSATNSMYCLVSILVYAVLALR